MSTGGHRSLIFSPSAAAPGNGRPLIPKKPIPKRPVPNKLGHGAAKIPKKTGQASAAAEDPAEERAPILILGAIERDLRLLTGDVKSLPRSEADYNDRLRLMLSAVHRLEEGIRQLLKGSL
jgi:hypothetical protein